MDTGTVRYTSDMQYRIDHGVLYHYLVKYRKAPDPLNGTFSVDNPWQTCLMTDNYDKAQKFIDEQKNKKIGVIQ